MTIKAILICLLATIVLAATMPSDVIAEDKADPVRVMSIEQKVEYYAQKYDVSETKMKRVIGCESSWNVQAIGDRNQSFGLSQINLPSHPTITKEQAFDPDFAIEFMANNFSQGKANMWSCYRILYAR